MNQNRKKLMKYGVYIFVTAVMIASTVLFHDVFLYLTGQVALYSAKSYLPQKGFTFPVSTTMAEVTEMVAESTQPTTAKPPEVTTQVINQSTEEDFSATPDDILAIISERKKTADKDKKDGSISEKKYMGDGVTDSFSRVRVKNTNKTKIDIEKILSEKIDLSVSKDKPSVLIFHTHTTETYQILDRGFYETGFMTRSSDKSRNMVRVGEEICREIEKAGFGVVHDKEIHDSKYTGAYAHSRKTVEQYLKQYPSIQVVLDIHRDAIQLSNGTKIKPTAKVQGKKAAQVMIISGCQEQGNGIENLPDWRYNLTFAVHLQDKLEELFPGITRPLFFCPRSYNMNVTHCSLLVEVGSDANTLEEAVYTGKCIGKALSEILSEYEEQR